MDTVLSSKLLQSGDGMNLLIRPRAFSPETYSGTFKSNKTVCSLLQKFLNRKAYVHAKNTQMQRYLTKY